MYTDEEIEKVYTYGTVHELRDLIVVLRKERQDLRQMAAERRDRVAHYQYRLNQANKRCGQAQRVIGRLTMAIETMRNLEKVKSIFTAPEKMSRKPSTAGNIDSLENE